MEENTEPAILDEPPVRGCVTGHYHNWQILTHFKMFRLWRIAFPVGQFDFFFCNKCGKKVSIP
jgi:hypothetical protein